MYPRRGGGRSAASARWLLAALVGAAALALASAGNAAAARFKQCPPVGGDTGCQFLIIVTNRGATVLEDSSQPPYEGSEDSLIGVQNNSSKPIQALPMSSSGLFSFDQDGICNPGPGRVPSGCRPAPGSPPGTTCGPQSGSCSFPAPIGQPPGYQEPGALTGNTQNGYEGPTTWFSNVSTDTSSGQVNFSPAVLPGHSTYFSLEEPPSASALKVGKPVKPPPPPPPVLGKSFDAAAVSGVVLVRLPNHGTGRKGFVQLTSATQLPVGTQVDSRHGTIALTAALPQTHKTESGKFGGALFGFSQPLRGTSRGVATLALLEGLFPGAPSYASCHRSSQRVLQTLHASDRGRFRSSGRYAAATVRGTKWDTTDRCDGTLITVKRGTVVVQDFVRHIRVVVHAHGQYLAKARA